MQKKEELEGKVFDSFNIYFGLYNSFPSYRDKVDQPNYEELMDNKYFQCVLGTMERRG